MNTVARMAPGDRRALFRQAAATRGWHELVIEKDFWACWTLHKLFSLPHLHGHLIFKGGTSLSKVYRAIERFSEDIDVSISRGFFGFSGAHDPVLAPRPSARNRLVKKLVEQCTATIGGDILTMLRATFAETIGEEGDTWSLQLADDDPQAFVFQYPGSTAGRPPSGYLTSQVKLEFGGRSDDWPSIDAAIQPYAADVFPHEFANPACKVKTLAVERTFWEKATILHAEYHRNQGDATPRHLARHYYDLVRLADHESSTKALRQLDILHHVLEYKTVFFPARWARYDEAAPGTFRLVPRQSRRSDLVTDYAGMEAMFFGDRPTFDQLLARLRVLEEDINKLKPPARQP